LPEVPYDFAYGSKQLYHLDKETLVAIFLLQQKDLYNMGCHIYGFTGNIARKVVGSLHMLGKQTIRSH